MTASKRKMIICGNGECGKDYIASAISNIFAVDYNYGTSWYAKDECYARALELAHTGALQNSDAVAIDPHHSMLHDEVSWWEARRSFRTIWVNTIAEINKRDKCALYHRCYSENDILTGLRREDELVAAYGMHKLTLSIWVDPVDGNGKSAAKEDHSQEFGAELCDVTIKNYMGAPHTTIFKLIKTLAYMGFQYRHQPYSTPLLEVFDYGNSVKVKPLVVEGQRNSKVMVSKTG